MLRAARRIEDALAGRRVRAEAPHRRGAAAGVGRLDGHRLERAEARGKHLLLHFGDLVLHSHLGMSGAWHVYPRGARWHRPRAAAWVVLSAEGRQAVQFGGPTLRVVAAARLRRDPRLARLGPDLLAAGFRDEDALASLRRADPAREVGDALLDQRLVAGIGNIFKSEGLHAAGIDPRARLADLGDERLLAAVAATRELMQESVRSGRRPRAVYRRAGERCRRCGAAIRARGQGDENRTTYWCPGCQGADVRARRAGGR